MWKRWANPMSDGGPGKATETLLMLNLEVAVPMWIERMQNLPWDLVQARTRECGQAVAERGDVIQFKGKKGESAEAFNRLAEGLACLSFAPGGVKFLGSHWEARHPSSPAPPA